MRFDGREIAKAVHIRPEYGQAFDRLQVQIAKLAPCLKCGAVTFGRAFSIQTRNPRGSFSLDPG